MTYDLKDPFWICFYQWQTLATGLLALIAALLTIWATNRAANREVSAAKEHTKAVEHQITVGLLVERRRIARESYAFLATLEAAMGTVLDDVEAAKKIFTGGNTSGHSVPAMQARQRIKKTAFNDLRTACLHLGGELTAPFLRLDKEIDDFSAQWIETPTTGDNLKMGANAGLSEQLDRVKLQATWLREEAAKGMKHCNEVLHHADAEKEG